MWILYVIGTAVLAAGVVWGMVTQPAPGKAHCEPQDVDPERLKADVRLLSEELPGRAWDDDVALNAADLIAQRFGAHGAAVDELIVEAKYGGVKSRVVIGRFGPETKKVIVVGAHYDTFEGLLLHRTDLDRDATTAGTRRASVQRRPHPKSTSRAVAAALGRRLFGRRANLHDARSEPWFVSYLARRVRWEFPRPDAQPCSASVRPIQ